MSKQTEAHRVAAAFNLEEAMRQAQRYLQSARPSARLLRQKADRIIELENELRKMHLLHCDKSNIDINSEEAKEYIQPKCDAAVDCVDECMLFIEDDELNRSKGEETKVKSDKEETEIKRRQAQIVGDERYAEDVAKKIQELVNTENHTVDNMVLMKTYCKRIQDIFDCLNEAWNTLIAMNDDNENMIKTREESNARLKI